MATAESHGNALTYRPDVDGLRALAVLSVIAFHASPTVLPGGYIGVDIFFVISGFLITSIICRNLDNSTFTYTDFYARRAKRIFPSLLIVLASTCFIGWLILLPDEYRQLGKHIAAGSGFISNFVLWMESGYFDKAAEYKPLLHLWSLGIEEQFYLLWPPLIVFIWRRKANVLSVACAIIAVSFVINVIFVSLWQATDTFYLPSTRFWELLAGGALGYAHLFKREELSRFASSANVQACLGVLLLLIAAVALNAELLFPGWWALLPTLGALLVINAGPAAWINGNFLSSRTLVFIGIISYPLYLWHWPLLSFASILDGNGKPPGSIRVVAVVLAFVLSWLTYRIVEKPVRSMPNRAAAVLVPCLIIVACVGLACFSHTFRARSEMYGLEKIINAKGEWDFPGQKLKLVQTDSGYYWERGETIPKILFLGDSNVEQYYPRVDKLLTDYPAGTKGVIFVTQHNCLPIASVSAVKSPKCAAVVETAFSLARDPSIDSVVIGASWSGYPVLRDPHKSEAAYRALEDIVRKFQEGGRRVYLILPMPHGGEFDPSHLVRRSFRDLGFTVGPKHIPGGKMAAAANPTNLALSKIAAATGAITLDPVHHLCRENDCPALTDDGLPTHMDYNHLRPAYVRENVTFLDPLVVKSCGQNGAPHPHCRGLWSGE
jgi:peptidoglycan/LPS O-acetylase OafA/YrhL